MHQTESKLYYDFLYTHFGYIRLIKNASGLKSLTFTGVCDCDISESALAPFIPKEAIHDEYALYEECKQIGLYATGALKKFDLELSPSGTDFQQSVWRELYQIPFGQVCSYLELAHLIEKPKAVRAVGGAVGKNPIPLIIPCHRVVGHQGAMTGFSAIGGIRLKKALLQHEGLTIMQDRVSVR